MPDYAITSKGTRGQVFLCITEKEALENLRRFKAANSGMKADLLKLPWGTPVEPRLRRAS